MQVAHANDDQVFEMLKTNGKLEGRDADTCFLRFAQGRDTARAGGNRSQNPYDQTREYPRWSQWNDGFTHECDGYFWPANLSELADFYDGECAA